MVSKESKKNLKIENNSKEKENVHAGHRERLRKIYMKNGIEALSEIQVLELLLFYSIPRKDTNEIAHALLDEYNNLEGVFQADLERLMLIKDVGFNSAVLIKLIQDLNLRMKTERLKKGVIFTDPRTAGDYIKTLFTGKQHEMLYAFFLNKGNRLLGWEKIADGAVDSISVDSGRIIRAALKYKTCYVMLAHNHPGGNATPSEDDKVTTNIISGALSIVGIVLKDHFIVTPDQVFSFLESNLFREDGYPYGKCDTEEIEEDDEVDEDDEDILFD